MNELPLLQETNTFITRISPQTITILIDELITKQIPIQLDSGHTQVVTGSIRYKQNTIGISLPKTSWDHIPAEDISRLMVEPNQDLSQLPAGHEVSVIGHLILPESLLEQVHLEVETSTVPIALTLASQYETITLNIPVWLNLPPVRIQQYDIKISQQDRLLSGLTFRGTKEAIERIKKRQLRVTANLTLDSDMLKKAADLGNLQAGLAVLNIPDDLESTQGKSFKIHYQVDKLTPKVQDTSPTTSTDAASEELATNSDTASPR